VNVVRLPWWRATRLGLAKMQKNIISLVLECFKTSIRNKANKVD